MMIRAYLLLLSLSTLMFAADAPVTFNKDVLPVLQKNCQTCHRPGQAAPMSFLTYESTRPWAKAMKQAVLQHKMPPWFAAPTSGHFLNDPSLKQAEIDVITRWADNGAPEGNPKDAPIPVQWPEGWRIQPDVIVKGPTFDVPGKPKNNVVEWVTVVVPTGFTKDTWITSVEIKPEFPEVTHHMCVAFVPHKAGVEYYKANWNTKERDEDGSALPDKGPTFTGVAAEDCYVPGNPAVDYRSLHAAKLVPAGTDMLMSLHYTPNGKDLTDHVQVGLTIAKEPPDRRYLSLNAGSIRDPKKFAIPPGDPNWESPPATVTFAQDVELVYMMPHMHARGKDMKYTLEYPDGRKEVILDVPGYDFNWQLGYLTSIPVPKGTKLRIDAHFDNSVNNKFNPNPNRTVYYGEMTWEEMMLGFFSVVVDGHADPQKILVRPTGSNGA
jgi:hypothetical protein